MDDDKRRKALGSFLRSRRARLRPADVGLPPGGRRRTPGLRREEVALLAGVGITWYTWLEQGRNISVSTQVLGSIAQALRLGSDETQHLLKLAVPPPDFGRGIAEAGISPALQRLVNHQGVFPALILDIYWDILAWNESAAALFGDFSRIPSHERNMVWITFTDTALQKSLTHWEDHAQRVLAQFRINYNLHIHDPRFAALTEQLQRESEVFRSWWQRNDVSGPLDVCKEFHHPQVGRLVMEQTVLLVSTAPEMHFFVYVPLPGTDTESKLRRLHAYALEG